MSRVLEIEAAGGAIDAHVFTPANASGPLSPVVLFTDIGGVRACYHAKAQTVADAGYAVLMPNIYYRQQAGQVVPDGKYFHDDDILPTLFEYAGQLTPQAQAEDFRALLDCIDVEPEFATGGVGVVGYCLTGAFALRMAAWHPARIAAAGAFHGARLAAKDDSDSPANEVNTIAAQVYLGHADMDEHMPPEQIAKLDGALADAGVHFTTELYRGALHGYTAKDSEAYDAAADARHYRRLFTLFDEALS